ncbi:inositol polyphosphate 5-phosphatase K-like [Arctopsyche grandis]|uniref:inositol polyphosphate 5-phosphatase K-like n=1 Tax=Arctopsyche grandis TaxID=121162 RepID=UPI00406DA447
MEKLRIYLSTWNVATNSPPGNLNLLLDFPPMGSKLPPDFYFIGFQEVKSQPQNILMAALFTDPWTDALTTLLTANEYVRVKIVRLQGLLLLVFCLRKHLLHLRDIETQYVKTGFGGVWGNKGAVSMRFSIYGCSICIVNSHLTAHDHQLEDRIADYNTIIKSNTFDTKDTTNILFHDYVFWFGDLNFRLEENDTDTPELIVELVKRAEKDDYSDLLDRDQLRSVMRCEKAFSELKEATPRFPPTYKYVIGTSEYDYKRKPAWTDRILHKVNPNNYENVTLDAVQLSYNYLRDFKISDHKPVIAEFNIKIRTVSKVITCYGLENVHAYSMTDSIPEDRVVFSNHVERCVEFCLLKDVWYFGDADLPIKFTLSSDVKINANDWIGIYEDNFSNLDEYISYEYVGKVSAFIPGDELNSRTIEFSFPVGSGVRTPGSYRFLYFNQTSSDVQSLLGISKPFKVCPRDGEIETPISSISSISSTLPVFPSSSTPDTSFNSVFRQFTNDFDLGVIISCVHVWISFYCVLLNPQCNYDAEPSFV